MLLSVPAIRLCAEPEAPPETFPVGALQLYTVPVGSNVATVAGLKLNATPLHNVSVAFGIMAVGLTVTTTVKGTPSQPLKCGVML